ncbi:MULTISPECIES: hypothetical protein [Pectobacterium]|uniref:Uncharacterized protein n=1 Tax=Pectobacterium carotovorum subsp. carotovorum (strain PC1) TaxID=561230 RepID=C6DEG8_PECCP|nr:hypothetical protein [Pectobacterium carotovorum]ACT12653.1 hypothetical protein PC1_1612 [Pectobacterium carotovorum subsp. carotovorum PC1]
MRGNLVTWCVFISLFFIYIVSTSFFFLEYYGVDKWIPLIVYFFSLFLVIKSLDWLNGVDEEGNIIKSLNAKWLIDLLKRGNEIGSLSRVLIVILGLFIGFIPILFF